VRGVWARSDLLGIQDLGFRAEDVGFNMFI